MTEYTFTSSTVLSQYKTNVQVTALYAVLIEIQKTPLIWLGDTQAVDKQDVINIITNKIKEIENKHDKLAEELGETETDKN